LDVHFVIHDIRDELGLGLGLVESPTMPKAMRISPFVMNPGMIVWSFAKKDTGLNHHIRQLCRGRCCICWWPNWIVSGMSARQEPSFATSNRAALQWAKGLWNMTFRMSVSKPVCKMKLIFACFPSCQSTIVIAG
jgi:hypothetical protein